MENFRPTDRAVRSFLFDQAVQSGQIPGPAEVATGLDLSTAEVTESLERLQAIHALVLAPLAADKEGIEMLAPFSAVPTQHTVIGDGEHPMTWWANCAWDALAILPMLGRNGEVRSICAASGEEIQIQVEGGKFTGEAVMHLLVPAQRWWAEIRHT